MARLASSQTQPEKGGSEPLLAKLTVPEVKRLLEIALPLPVRSPELRLAWSRWRRTKKQQARQCYYRGRSDLSLFPSLLQPP